MKKTVKELGIFIVIIVILKVSGLLPEITGLAQRALLSTGLMNPDLEEVDQDNPADYNFQITSLQGEAVEFESLKGKVVFLNLWATWCGPCIAEMPNIHALYESINDDNVVFVMLTLDDDPKKAKKFIERKGYDFPVYYPTSRMPSIYQTGSIPTTHVISPDGKIIFTKAGTSNYDTDEFRDFLLSNIK